MDARFAGSTHKHDKNENNAHLSSVNENGVNWEEVHRIVCLKKSTLSLPGMVIHDYALKNAEIHQNYLNDLDHTSKLLGDEVSATRGDNDDHGEDTKIQSLNDMLKLLSSSSLSQGENQHSYLQPPCVIVSPESCSSIIEDIRCNGYGRSGVNGRGGSYSHMGLNCNPFFVLRSLSSEYTNGKLYTNAKRTNTEPQESSSLVNMFSSLSIGSKPESKGNDKIESRLQVSANIKMSEMMHAAACIVAHHTIISSATFGDFQNVGDDLLDTKTSITSTAPKHESAGANSKGVSVAGSVLHLSKRMFTKASSVVNSIMASYDLTEQDQLQHEEYDYGNADTDADLDQDDANLYGRHGDICDFDDDDDANQSSRESQLARSEARAKAQTRTLTMVQPDDIIWNVELFASCWKAILDHAEYVILTREQIGDDNGLTTLNYTDISSTPVGGSVGIDPGVGDSDSGECGHCHDSSKITGLILNRYGASEDPSSLHSFFHETGIRLKRGAHRVGVDADDVDSDLGAERFFPDNSSISNGIANILQKISNGTTMEILIGALLATSKARLSPEGDLIILFPFAAKMYASTNEHTQQVNEVDLAIFKINNAIQTLERKLEHRTKQADQAYQKALSVKRVGAGNQQVLLHLKRRNLYQKEAEHCASLILNLEGGLHSIKRAKDDAEILRTYKLMNSSMKFLREESGLEQEDVDNVMVDLLGHGDDLNDIHESLTGCAVGGNVSTDQICNDELEEELAQLMREDDMHGRDRTTLDSNDERIFKLDNSHKDGNVDTFNGQLKITRDESDSAKRDVIDENHLAPKLIGSEMTAGFSSKVAL